MARLRVAVTLEQCWHRVPGGTASSAIGATRALDRRGGLDLTGVSARHRGAPSPPWVPPIPVQALPLPRRALYETWHRLRWPAVERATGPVDVVYVTGMAMPPRSAPLVVTVHDLAFRDHPEHSSRHGVAFFERAIELAQRDADAVVCPSQATLAECVAAGFDRERLRVIPWGVDVDVAAGADDVARVRARYRLDGRYVVWNGTIEPRKNLSGLLDAFGALDRDDVELVLVGPEGWNEDLGARLGAAAGRVRWLGFVPEDDRRALFAGAAAFCLPSLREGFGLPVLEAMAQGAPVITSSGTATAEVAGTAGLLVDPRDPAALAAALASVLDDTERAERMRAASVQQAARFGWAGTADALADLFEQVAG